MQFCLFFQNNWEKLDNFSQRTWYYLGIGVEKHWSKQPLCWAAPSVAISDNMLFSNYGNESTTMRTQRIQNSKRALKTPQDKTFYFILRREALHAAAGRKEGCSRDKTENGHKKDINNANTIRERRRRRRQVPHPANHGCAHWCRRRTWGRSLTFGPRWRHGGKLLWLVVEGRCGDFEVEGGGHHVWLVTAGVLHVAVSIWDGQRETQSATVRYSESKMFAVSDESDSSGPTEVKVLFILECARMYNVCWGWWAVMARLKGSWRS